MLQHRCTGTLLAQIACAHIKPPGVTIAKCSTCQIYDLKWSFATVQHCLSHHNPEGAAAAAAHHQRWRCAQGHAAHAEAGPARAALLAMATQRVRQQLPAIEAHISTCAECRDGSWSNFKCAEGAACHLLIIMQELLLICALMPRPYKRVAA